MENINTKRNEETTMTKTTYVDPHYRQATVKLSPHDCVVIMEALDIKGEQARIGKMLAEQLGSGFVDWQNVFSQDSE